MDVKIILFSGTQQYVLYRHCERSVAIQKDLNLWIAASDMAKSAMSSSQ